LIVALATLLLGCAGAEKQRWTSVKLDRLEVISSLPNDRTNYRVKDLLRFQAVVEGLTGTKPAPDRQPTRIYLFSKARSLDPYAISPPIRNYFRPAQHLNMIVVDDEAPERGERVMYHEYAHILLHAQPEVVYPSWYEEGFATFMSTTRFSRESVELGRRHEGLVRVLGTSTWLPYEEVLGWNAWDPTDPQTTLRLYAQSYALVHWFRMGPAVGLAGRAEQTRAYLDAVGGGGSPAAAFETSFGVPPASLEKELLVHLADLRIPFTPYPERDFLLRLDHPEPVELSHADVHVRLGELSLELTPDHVQLAEYHGREALALEPGSAGAHLILARAKAKRGAAGADADFLAASKQAPNDPEVAAFHAQHLLNAVGDGGAGKQGLARATELLEAAVSVRSNDAFTQWLIGRAAELGGDLKNAREALEKAWALNRFEPMIAIDLARLSMQTDQRARGCRVIGQLRHRLHLSADASSAMAPLVESCAAAEPSAEKPVAVTQSNVSRADATKDLEPGERIIDEIIGLKAKYPRLRPLNRAQHVTRSEDGRSLDLKFTRGVTHRDNPDCTPGKKCARLEAYANDGVAIYVYLSLDPWQGAAAVLPYRIGKMQVVTFISGPETETMASLRVDIQTIIEAERDALSE
jgi:hypothetical protein